MMSSEPESNGDKWKRGPHPPIICNLPDDAAYVRDIGGLRVQVRFNDGTSGVVHMSGMVLSVQAGVFAALRDPAVFGGVHVHYGVVTWPGEIDLAPDAMYEEFKKNGEWVLD